MNDYSGLEEVLCAGTGILLGYFSLRTSADLLYLSSSGPDILMDGAYLALGALTGTLAGCLTGRLTYRISSKALQDYRRDSHG